MSENIEDNYKYLRNISKIEKDIIIKELFDDNNNIILKINIIFIGKEPRDETYQAVLNYENKITNNFLYSILPNKNYVDYFYKKDYHRSISELSDEMERDLLSNLELIKELFDIRS